PRANLAGPGEKSDDRKERDAAHHAVGEFDDGSNLRSLRKDVAVAQRPVAAAAGARTGGAHQRTPKNDSEVIGENTPGKRSEVASPTRKRQDLPRGEFRREFPHTSKNTPRARI